MQPARPNPYMVRVGVVVSRGRVSGWPEVKVAESEFIGRTVRVGYSLYRMADTRSDAFLRTEASFGLQEPMDVAVIIPTVLRPTLRRAVESVFSQNFPGRMHVLVGVDLPQGDLSLPAPPDHCALQVFYPGYSTSVRHGGLAASSDGGVLRCVLTHLANSRYIAYLDDDNWWAPSHLADLRYGIERTNAEWGFSLRWYVHPETSRPVCVDAWESVGPGHGVFARQFGGFVDPSSLMIDKLACPRVAHCWNFPLLAANGGSTDRQVFHLLSQQHRYFATGHATSFYTLNPVDGMHLARLAWMGDAYEKAARTNVR